jgi:hypothetical protein
MTMRVLPRRRSVAPVLVLCIVATAIAPCLGQPHTSPSEPAVMQLQPQLEKTTGAARPTVEEIKKLIVQLGDSSFKLREKALTRLGEIGLPALAALEEAEEHDDHETRGRAALLANKIRIANHRPTRVKGVEFKLLVPKIWKIPRGEDESTIEVRLQIKRVLGKPCKLLLARCWTIILQDSKGATIPRHAWPTDRIMRGVGEQFTPLLAKGEAYTVSTKASLKRVSESCELVWRNASLEFFDYNSLIKDFYRISATYQTEDTVLASAIPNTWIGEPKTEPELIKIDY